MQIKLLTPTATIPTRGTSFAAGLDLYYDGPCVTLAPGEIKLCRTGVAMSIPEYHWGEIKPRSGLALRHGIDVMAGVIDADYRGEVHVLLINHSNMSFIISQGDRIAQIVIQKYTDIYPEVVDELDSTVRGENGYGSTGR